MPAPVKTIDIDLTRTTNPGAWSGFVANPLDVNVEFSAQSGLTFDGATLLRCELHADRLVSGSDPLAVAEQATPTGRSQLFSFTPEQLNQPLNGQTRRAFWLVVYATYADDAIAMQVFQLGTLTLVAHPASATVPPPPVTAITLPLTGEDDPRGVKGSEVFDSATGILYRKVSIDPHLWVALQGFTPGA